MVLRTCEPRVGSPRALVRSTGHPRAAVPSWVLAVACVLCGALAATQAMEASASSRQGTAACNAPWAQPSLSADIPGNRVTPKRLLLAVGNPTGFDGGSPAVWTRRDRRFASVVARRVAGRFRLWTCTVTTAELTRKRPALRTFGREIALRRGDRPVAAFVADRWISWVTTRPGRSGFVLRRQTLAGRRLSSRSLPGRLLELVMTRDGTVAVSSLAGNRQRITEWSSSRRAPTTLVSRRIANVKRHWNETVAIELWDPDSFLLTTPTENRAPLPNPVAAGRIRTTSRYRPCRTWPLPDDAPRSADSPTDPRVTLTSTDSWSRRARFDIEGPGSWTRMEACDAVSGTRTLAVNAGLVSDDVDMAEDTLRGVVTVGGAIFAVGYASEGYTGSGSSSAPYDVGFVRRDDGWVTVARHVATPGAAAWLADGQLWALDANGTRSLGPAPDGFRGFRLRRDGTALDVVAKTETTAITLVPLPPGRSWFPSPAQPFSPMTTKLADGTVAAANFGVCSDQHASYCPDPRTLSVGAAR